jgi:hypothetical protein
VLTHWNPPKLKTFASLDRVTQVTLTLVERQQTKIKIVHFWITGLTQRSCMINKNMSLNFAQKSRSMTKLETVSNLNKIIVKF